MTTDKINGMTDDERQNDIHLAEMNEQYDQMVGVGEVHADHKPKQFEEQKCYNSRFDVQIDHSAFDIGWKKIDENTWEKEKFVETIDGVDIYRLTTTKWLETEQRYNVRFEEVIYEEV